jgi:myo-inositol-1(or 4)-monophosphatase
LGFEMTDYLTAAMEAAHAAGGLLRAHFERPLAVDANEAHDIKLELDRRTQELIEGLLLGRFPGHAFLGEEGMKGAAGSPYEWIVDPIDGTVNFFYGIPHFAISIALRHAGKIVTGVIYDPMRDELWAADEDGPATMNGHKIRVSERTLLSDAIISVGVAKTAESIESGLAQFGRLVRSVKKCRMMGSAALDIAYVANGRLDAYIESQISIWDIAAGWLILERAGGKVDLKPHPTAKAKFSIVATAGSIDFGV